MKKTKYKQIILTAFAGILFTGLLFLINRDLFTYSYTYPFSRTFLPEIDAKGDYILTGEIALKPADYLIRIDGDIPSRGNGFFIESADEILFSSDLNEEMISEGYGFTMDKFRNVRVGIRYDPQEKITIRSITISSQHVLYKESLCKHLVLSAAVTMIFICFLLRVTRPQIFGASPKQLKKSEITLIILIGLTVLSSYPYLIKDRYIVGDDLYFHLYRIEGIAAGLKHGYFPVKIYLAWLENYGVGTGFYYPDLFIYIPAALRLAGFDLLSVYNFFILLCTLSAMISIYFSAKCICGCRRMAGLISAGIYAFASYRLICLNYRNALGEVQAFIFIPLILWGMYEMLHSDPKSWRCFALGFIGLACSHLISLALMTVIVLCCFLIRIRKIVRSRDLLSGILKSLGLTILLTTCFWAPMIEQMAKNDLFFNTFMFSKNNSLSAENFLHWKFLFSFFETWDYFTPYPGILIMCVVFLRVIFFAKDHNRKLFSDSVFLIGFVCLILSTDLFPWQPFSWFLKRIQVSWRFLTPASAALAISGGELLSELFSKKYKYFGIACTILIGLICTIPINEHCLNHRSLVNNGQILNDKAVHASEYMPPGLTVQYVYKNKDRIFTDNPAAVISDQKRNGLDIIFNFSGTEEKETSFTLPLIYHFGYQAEISDENGNRDAAVEKNDSGLIIIRNQGLSSGKIHVFYQKTVIQYISEAVTAVSLLFAILYTIRKSTYKKMAKVQIRN